jgi:hypothetical protein
LPESPRRLEALLGVGVRRSARNLGAAQGVAGDALVCRRRRATKAIATRHAFPEDKHLVPIADAEFKAFMKGLEKL